MAKKKENIEVVEKNKKDSSQEELSKNKIELEKLNKEFKTSFVTFDDSKTSNIKYISSGNKDLDYVLSERRDDGGYARGRFIEIYGPEGSGKTFILTQLYAYCQQNGLSVAHYDAEGTYNKKFANIYGVDTSKLAYSDEDKAEKIFEEVESLCQKDVFDVIAIDSLAALVPMNTLGHDMGAQNYSPLAGCVSRCIPRLSSAVKRSKTILILINQVRDNVGVMHGPAEKTPGGRAIKFHASIRLEARKVSANKTDRPDLFDAEGHQIGHVLRIKCTKNKIVSPFKVCEIDLMYKLHRPIIRLIKEGIETDVIKRFRNKNGELYGKRIEFEGVPFTPASKEDYESVLLWLKENNLICKFLEKMNVDDFDQFVESGDLDQEMVNRFLSGEVEEVAEVEEKKFDL